MSIGQATKMRLLELCEKNGLTINALCIISGVTQSTVNNLMSGRNNSITISTLKKLCDGLNIFIGDFFDSDLFRNLAQEIK